ncbi:MAG: alpha-1,2-fucosyltransferase [Myxacorys chilensis ATA2-1-KO14]|jgi:hypothetical protein|nr:alpha-1,2-fucosyltransferase [Myxacorys chilensis ATA2-1-KO14]
MNGQVKEEFLDGAMVNNSGSTIMNRPKTVFMRLDGRLGNQLFQLAVALNISQKFQVEVLLDEHLPKRLGFESFLFKELSVFNYFRYCSKTDLLINRIRNNSTFRKLFKEESIFVENENSHRKLDFSQPYKSYTGYFQSPSLFPDKEVLVKAFSLRSEFICESLSKLLDLAKGTESLAVSIRRGDFLQAPHLGACPSNYYFDAIDFVKNRRKIDYIFVFSDDIGHCRELLAHLDCKVVYVEGFAPPQSLYLMSLCKHFVIANSTFSWWGAWLSQSSNKLVVSPSPWNDKEDILPDFIPPDWVSLSKYSIPTG